VGKNFSVIVVYKEQMVESVRRYWGAATVLHSTVKKLWRQNFSGSARLAQTFSGFSSIKIRLGFGSNVFRL